jgi:hypothetical protein
LDVLLALGQVTDLGAAERTRRGLIRGAHTSGWSVASIAIAARISEEEVLKVVKSAEPSERT